MRVVKSPHHAHVEWIELYSDGVLHECAVLKADPQGNKLLFPTNHLDDIDRKRLAGILLDRNARNFELWDLMAQKTLGNGMNALQYFHQYVKVLTPQGKMIDPKSGQIGVPVGTVKLDDGQPSAI
jgi:hypothetical protein